MGTEKTLYEELREKALPLIEAYHDDLLIHDKKMIEENPEIPFLHFTGDTGTYLISLTPADQYPARGELVKFLFGMADREHILRETGKVVKHMKRVNRGDLVMYFDGEKLKTITQERAEEIAAQYQNKIWRDWRKHDAEKLHTEEQRGN